MENWVNNGHTRGSSFRIFCNLKNEYHDFLFYEKQTVVGIIIAKECPRSITSKNSKLSDFLNVKFFIMSLLINTEAQAMHKDCKVLAFEVSWQTKTKIFRLKRKLSIHQKVA